MAKEDEKQEVEEPKEKWGIGQVPESTKEVVVDLETQRSFTVPESIGMVLNEMEEIKKTLAKILKKVD